MPSSISVMDIDTLIPLSPSRTSDFKACPQLFKFRVIDRLPEPEDPASARGTLVHSVLETLLGEEPDQRTFERSQQILKNTWADLKTEMTEAGLVLDADQETVWLGEADHLLHNYFRIEDPSSISTHELEWWVEHQSDNLLLRGIIDRVEVDADGAWVLSDYKTGRSPNETYALGSFFGLKFYALVCWRAFGKMPAKLRLMHLREPEVLTLVPTEQMLEAFERQMAAIGKAIDRALDTGDFRPRPSYMCSWCPHRPICPAHADDVAMAAG